MQAHCSGVDAYLCVSRPQRINVIGQANSLHLVHFSSSPSRPTKLFHSNRWNERLVAMAPTTAESYPPSFLRSSAGWRAGGQKTEGGRRKWARHQLPRFLVVFTAPLSFATVGSDQGGERIEGPDRTGAHGAHHSGNQRQVH